MSNFVYALNQQTCRLIHNTLVKMRIADQRRGARGRVEPPRTAGLKLPEEKTDTERGRRVDTAGDLVYIIADNLNPPL